MELLFPLELYDLEQAEEIMDTAIERVMHTYGMIQNLTPDEEQKIRAEVTEYMAKQSCDGDEQRLTISGLKFLRQRYS